MTTLEIFLLAAGILCIIVSFIMPASAAVKSADTSSLEPELSQYQLDVIHRKVDEAVSQELDEAIEKTEVSLDKLSNTKILEMQEYADTIFSEMNRNHNETMFLYDMLNDKAKEVKSIVRDIQTIKPEEESRYSAGSSASEQAQRDNELIEKLLLQAADEEAVSEPENEVQDSQEKTSINEAVLNLYQQGKSVLEIAKELNLGIGQTKLVIDLFKGTK